MSNNHIYYFCTRCCTIIQYKSSNKNKNDKTAFFRIGERQRKNCNEHPFLFNNIKKFPNLINITSNKQLNCIKALY